MDSSRCPVCHQECLVRVGGQEGLRGGNVPAKRGVVRSQQHEERARTSGQRKQVMQTK